VVLERLEALRRSNFCNMSASVPKTYYLFHSSHGTIQSTSHQPNRLIILTSEQIHEIFSAAAVPVRARM
jgi:hypothetical protein